MKTFREWLLEDYWSDESESEHRQKLAIVSTVKDEIRKGGREKGTFYRAISTAASKLNIDKDKVSDTWRNRKLEVGVHPDHA